MPQSELSSADRIATNGVYKFETSWQWIILIFGAAFILLPGVVFTSGLHNHDKTITPAIEILGVLELLAVVAAMIYGTKRSSRRLQIDSDGISVAYPGGKITSLLWAELGSVSDRLVMGQLVLSDRAGTRRVLVDQEFENYSVIRARILAEYGKVFVPKPLPMELRRSRPLYVQMFMWWAIAIFFGVIAFLAYRQNEIGPALLFCFFVILDLCCLLQSCYPQLWGPSILSENRLVLRSAFRTRKLYRTDVIRIELQDVAGRNGTRWPFVCVVPAMGKPLKISCAYGSMPELYLTLQAWLRQR